MSVIHAKEFVEQLRDNLQYDGEWDDNSTITCRGLYYILKQLVKELDREN